METGAVVFKNRYCWFVAEMRQHICSFFRYINRYTCPNITSKLPRVNSNFPEKIVLFPVVLTWYCVTEIGSIVENAGRLGAPIPKLLKNAIAALNDALDDEPHN